MSAAPLGLNKCVPISNPGLTPWAMQEYRPYRAPLRLPYHFIILMCLPCITSPLGDALEEKALFIEIVGGPKILVSLGTPQVSFR